MSTSRLSVVEEKKKCQFSEPALIGREDELSRLAGQMNEACRGMPRMVCLEGLSGHGKSRLVNEFIGGLPAEVMVLEGQGVSQAAGRPFQILVNVVQHLLALIKSDKSLARDLAHDTAEWSSTLCAVLPELKALYGDEVSGGSAPESFNEDRTLLALCQFLNALGSSSRRVLLILDDCQWADEMTLKLLSKWKREREQRKSAIMTVLAFRTEETPAEHPLRLLSPDAHIKLTKLSDEAVRQVVASIAGNLPEEAMRIVTRLAGGNPFIAGTVLRGFAELGILAECDGSWVFKSDAVTNEMTAGDSAQAFILRRVEILPPELITLLKAAAILGKEFDGGTAATVAGCSPDLFVEARHRHIVRPLGDGRRFAFIHDKLRETLLSMLTGEERRLACMHIAAIVEQRQADNVFDLAFYFDLAGDYRRALPYALRAAEEARSRASLKLAEQHYRLALKGLDPAEQHLRYKINRGLGEVLMLRGRYEEALQIFAIAREAAAEGTLEAAYVDYRIAETFYKVGDADGTAARVRESLRSMGARFPSNRAEVMVKLMKEVFVQTLHTWLPSFFLRRRSLEQGERDLLICRLHGLLSYAMWAEEGYKYELLLAHLRSLNLSELYPVTLELSHAYSCHGPAMTYVALFNRGLRYCTSALRMAREIKSLWAEGHAHNFHGITALPASRFAEAIDHLHEASRQLKQAGDLWEYDMANVNLAYALYRAGNLQQAALLAERTFQESMESHDTMTAASALSALAKATAGNFPFKYVEQLRPLLAPSACQPHVEMEQAVSLFHAAQGKYELAIANLEKQFRRVVANGVTQEYLLPVLPWLVTMIRLKLESDSVRQFTREDHARLRRALRLCLRARFTAHFYRNNLPHVLRESGLLHLLRGDKKRAAGLLRKSLKVSESIGSRHEYVQSLWALARAGRASETPGWREIAARAQSLFESAKSGELFLKAESDRPN